MDSNLDQHNKGGLWAFLLSVIFCAVFFVYIAVIHPGIDLKEVAPEQDTSAPKVDLAAIAKPWEENADLLARGTKVFEANCAVCHGEKGLGNGPGGAALNPPPRNFVEGKWTHGGQSHQLFHTVTEGINGTSMAAFKHLSKTDRWAVVQFVRSITKNKVKDDPAAVEKFAASAQ